MESVGDERGARLVEGRFNFQAGDLAALHRRRPPFFVEECGHGDHHAVDRPDRRRRKLHELFENQGGNRFRRQHLPARVKRLAFPQRPFDELHDVVRFGIGIVERGLPDQGFAVFKKHRRGHDRPLQVFGVRDHLRFALMIDIGNRGIGRPQVDPHDGKFSLEPRRDPLRRGGSGGRSRRRRRQRRCGHALWSVEYGRFNFCDRRDADVAVQFHKVFDFHEFDDLRSTAFDFREDLVDSRPGHALPFRKPVLEVLIGEAAMFRLIRVELRADPVDHCAVVLQPA